jgi:hypothetical protein
MYFKIGKCNLLSRGNSFTMVINCNHKRNLLLIRTNKMPMTCELMLYDKNILFTIN